MQPVARFSIRVQPRARENAVQGWEGGVLRLRVTAPPADGQANAAVVALLVAALDTGKTAISVVRGYASRDKVVEVRGLTADEVRRRLG